MSRFLTTATARHAARAGTLAALGLVIVLGTLAALTGRRARAAGAADDGPRPATVARQPTATPIVTVTGTPTVTAGATQTGTPAPSATPSPAATRRPIAPPAYFRIGFEGRPTVTFVIELTDSERIAEARALAGSDENRSVMGEIVKRPAWYNAGWSYHLDPATISFFDVAVEVCDANPIYVERHLEEACGAFLPGCVWCPWSSYVAAEVDPTALGRIFLPVGYRLVAARAGR